MGNRIDPTLCNDLSRQVLDAMSVVAATLPPDATTKEAWTVVENYVATAIHVFSKTNPSKVREAAQTVHIQNLIRGV